MYQIPKSVYIFVIDVKSKRCNALSEEMYPFMSASEKTIFDRRKNNLFTFYSQTSLHAHIKKMKAHFVDIPNMSTFIVHNIRALRIRDVYNKQGLEAAQKIGKHSRPETTF